MNNTKYAFAAASVRAAENELLDSAFISQLVEINNYDEAVRILSGKGIDISETSDYMDKVFDYLSEIAPDKSELNFLIVRNDFHNLKAVLKGLMTNTDGRRFGLTPCLISIDELYEVVNRRAFEELPPYIAETAVKAYELLTTANDVRMCDVYVDRCSFEAMFKMADSHTKNSVNEIISLANIRIAARFVSSSADEAILDYAFYSVGDITSEELKSAVLRGKERFAEWVGSGKFSDLLPNLFKPALLERDCADIINKGFEEASRISFGIEPLVAYYFKKETELFNIRLIIGGLRAGLPKNMIKERVRKVYV